MANAQSFGRAGIAAPPISSHLHTRHANFEWIFPVRNENKFVILVAQSRRRSKYCAISTRTFDLEGGFFRNSKP